METMTVQRDRGLVILTLNRPEKKNAIDTLGWIELEGVLTEVEGSPSDRALIITGAGGNFCSGADLTGGRSFHELSGESEPRPLIESMRRMGSIILKLQRLPKPTLAKVDGVAVGVGLGVALACDLLVASDRARFSAIFAKRGLALDGGTSWILPRLVGMQKAKELAFLGDIMTAAEAVGAGLVNRVVPAAELDAFAGGWARRLAEGPTLALGLSKKLLNSSLASSFDDALEDEGRCQHILSQSHDMREAMQAFRDKREPLFKGF
jgi:2-(1,2-epoxy-1,2-dihydrophenyl)acetyl-CoA isomerase